MIGDLASRKDLKNLLEKVQIHDCRKHAETPTADTGSRRSYAPRRLYLSSCMWHSTWHTSRLRRNHLPNSCMKLQERPRDSHTDRQVDYIHASSCWTGRALCAWLWTRSQVHEAASQVSSLTSHPSIPFYSPYSNHFLTYHFSLDMHDKSGYVTRRKKGVIVVPRPEEEARQRHDQT